MSANGGANDAPLAAPPKVPSTATYWAGFSGGLDSSIVTTLASRHSGHPLKTFTGAFAEGPEFDESHYAREVAEACNAESFVAVPGETEFIDLLPGLIWHMDEPAAGPGGLASALKAGSLQSQRCLAMAHLAAMAVGISMLMH